MKYRTLELIGSLILAGVAAAMATKAHAGPVDDCLAYAEFAQKLDGHYARGVSLGEVVSTIATTPGSESTKRILIELAIVGYEVHRDITPAQAYAVTFDTCMRGWK